MNAAVWKRKKRRGVEFEETTNREGQWARDFSVRAESWPIIEHWARECGFHMIACKARRRLYQKGSDLNYYTTFLDIRHDEHRVIIAGWIQVGFRLRLLSAFMLPRRLAIEPRGFRGIRVRRQACADFNIFLGRFRQPLIVGSRGLHIADLDFSSLLLLGGLLSVLGAFTSFCSTRMEVVPGLSNALLSELLNKTSVLAGVGFALFCLHHWAIARRVEELWKKIFSASLVGIAFTGLSLFFLTRTVNEFREQKFSHHCVVHFEAKSCTDSLATFSKRDREVLVLRLESLQKELAVKK